MTNNFEVPENKTINAGTIYEGFQGGNYHRWADAKELKSLLLADFKRAGIKATVRSQHTPGYLGMTFTMTAGAEEVKSFEEWRADSGDIYIKPNNWYYYTDEAGKARDIFGQSFYALDPNAPETAALKDSIIKHLYEERLCCFNYSNCTIENCAEVLKPAAVARLRLLEKIVTSYNRDESDMQTDYFARSIYDHYSVKIA